MQHDLKIKFGSDVQRIINYFLDELKYESIIIYRADPDKEYVNHYHPVDQYRYILDGLMEGEIEGRHIVLNPGDGFFFPAKVPHIAKIGGEGCKYLIALQNGNYSTVFLK